MSGGAGAADVADLADALDDRLAAADEDLRRRYPGEPAGRQPVSTAYVPADAFCAAPDDDWGRRARAALDEHAPTPEALAAATGVPPSLAGEVHARVRAKLDREPVEDLRIDFEDGYGDRGDEEEDAAAAATGRALGAAARAGAAPAFSGIRMKSLERPTRRRGLRTLDGVLAALSASGGPPAGFVVTLPKVTSVAQVEAMGTACGWLERAHGLPAGALRYEIQVETPQAVLAADGTAAVARMVHAAAGRCTGLHYGTYDYSAACGIPAGQQSLEHPVADHARAVMQLAAAGTGVRLCDGSTNVLPVGDGDAVRAAWRLHARLVRRSLDRGYYQGWDLHPAQLVSRYAAAFAFYREGLPSAADRLRRYLDRAASGVLEEPATARALAGFLLRGTDCGAVDPAEVTGRAGVDGSRLAALARRSAA